MAGISTVPISKVRRGNLWVIYGRSNSGKDVTASSFPKPLLYIPVGDDGRNSIKHVEGIRTIPEPVSTMVKLKKLMKQLLTDEKYRTVVISTFSFFTAEWKDEKVGQMNRRMTQQLWGDLASDTEDIIRICKKLAKTREVVLICHEAMDDHIEDMEGEITPNIRPNVTRGARPYLEGMANYGLHCAKFSKEVEAGEETKVLVKYGCHIGPSSYYWTKVQSNPSIKIPPTLINPTYAKIMKILGEANE